jgi:hypothetical protein
VVAFNEPYHRKREISLKKKEKKRKRGCWSISLGRRRPPNQVRLSFLPFSFFFAFFDLSLKEEKYENLSSGD